MWPKCLQPRDDGCRSSTQPTTRRLTSFHFVRWRLRFQRTQFWDVTPWCGVPMAIAFQQGRRQPEVLCGPCPVQAAFRLAFGRDLLSNQYSKISKLVSLGKSGASASRPAATVTAWLVDQLLLLRGKQVLDRDRKSGSPGFWPCCLVILQAQVANKCSCQR